MTTVIACHPVEKAPQNDAVEGACALCGRAVWIGEKQRRALDADPEAVVECVPCVRPVFDLALDQLRASAT